MGLAEVRHCLLESYPSLGYEVLILPKVTVPERACQVLKRGRRIYQPLSKNTQSSNEPAATRSARAIAITRCAKAIPSTHGRAEPPLASSSLTIRRELAPDNARYAYVYAVALNSTGAQGDALALLEQAHRQHPADRDVLTVLVSSCVTPGS